MPAQRYTKLARQYTMPARQCTKPARRTAQASLQRSPTAKQLHNRCQHISQPAKQKAKQIQQAQPDYTN